MSSLPIFPKFEKLNLNHKDVLQAIANNFPSSDFNFAGLFTWDVDEVVEVSSLYGNLVIRSSDYLTHEAFYSFIGDNKVDETIKTLVEYAERRGETKKLRLITESVVKNIDTNAHNIIEDRDNHDYIYSVEDLVNLAGGKFKQKRKTINKYQREHGKNSRELELNLNDESVLKDIRQVLSRWQQSREKKIHEVRDEFIAIKKALDHHDVLGIRAFGVYQGKVLVAFTLFEILPTKVAISHFAKADLNYQGIYEHMKHNLANHLTKFDVKYMNVEQDLGIEGLRISKESYHPVEYIKKYTVERIK